MPDALPGSIANVQQQLSLLDGATLLFWGLRCSYCVVFLQVTGGKNTTGYVGLTLPEYLDLPAEMHNVRLRLATQEETENLRSRLPPQRARYLQNNDHLIIMCDEGKAEVWARAIGLNCKLSSPEAFINWVSGPIGPGGPALKEL